jgi:hypothetical protein
MLSCPPRLAAVRNACVGRETTNFVRPLCHSGLGDRGAVAHFLSLANRQMSIKASAVLQVRYGDNQHKLIAEVGGRRTGA